MKTLICFLLGALTAAQIPLGSTFRGGPAQYGVTIDITAPPYNAVCDGVQDTATKFDAAISAGSAMGVPVTITVPQGVTCLFNTYYYVIGNPRNITMRNNVTIEGLGTGARLLQGHAGPVPCTNPISNPCQGGRSQQMGWGYMVGIGPDYPTYQVLPQASYYPVTSANLGTNYITLRHPADVDHFHAGSNIVMFNQRPNGNLNVGSASYSGGFGTFTSFQGQDWSDYIAPGQSITLSGFSIPGYTGANGNITSATATSFTLPMNDPGASCSPGPNPCGTALMCYGCDVMVAQVSVVQSIDPATGRIYLIDPIVRSMPSGSMGGGTRIPVVAEVTAQTTSNAGLKNLTIQGASPIHAQQVYNYTIQNCRILTDDVSGNMDHVGYWYVSAYESMTHSVWDNNVWSNTGDGRGWAQEMFQRNSGFNTMSNSSFGGPAYPCASGFCGVTYYGNAEFHYNNIWTGNHWYLSATGSTWSNALDFAGINDLFSNNDVHIVGPPWGPGDDGTANLFMDGYPTTTSEGDEYANFLGNMTAIGNTWANCNIVPDSGAGQCLTLNYPGGVASNNTIHIVPGSYNIGIRVNQNGWFNTAFQVNNNTINTQNNFGIRVDVDQNDGWQVNYNTITPHAIGMRLNITSNTGTCEVRNNNSSFGPFGAGGASCNVSGNQ